MPSIPSFCSLIKIRGLGANSEGFLLGGSYFYTNHIPIIMISLELC